VVEELHRGAHDGGCSCRVAGAGELVDEGAQLGEDLVAGRLCCSDEVCEVAAAEACALGGLGVPLGEEAHPGAAGEHQRVALQVLDGQQRGLGPLAAAGVGAALDGAGRRAA
jgi:hypothetical protein